MPLLRILTHEDQYSLIPYIKPAHEHMNKNSTGRVRLKPMLKISLSCLSGYIKEKWPHVQRENRHGRLHRDLAERWRRYNYFYFLFSSQINSMASPWDEKYLLRQQLNATPCINLFSEDSKKKKNQLQLLQYLFVAADAVLELLFYERNLDRSYDKLARLPGFPFLPAL